ncbi:hypothetical protein [Burkholderia vietnamiensis]|uniref:hypothetical protein n=1 Tax=Burkholderia vietnamiensis TaxID=60552 RepID=UPI001BA2127C|nr:hypothetical protein [Burkholderia vietnamiensis]MBR8054198.1 hypothetical protein [Burkholderia vietnamiensis]
MQNDNVLTYANQPDNIGAWRIGEACREANAGGDPIDHGLSLLKELQARGYGIVALAAHPGQPEPIAWESTTVAYTKYITDERYQKFSSEVQKWYKPFRCSACTEPHAEVERSFRWPNADREATVAEILRKLDGLIKKGPLDEPAHSERNGLVLAFNEVALLSTEQSEPHAAVQVPCPICSGKAIGHIDMLERVTIAPRSTADATRLVRAYPDELIDDLRHVLGRPNFWCGRIARVMRAAGADIKTKAEDEQAHVLHWLVKLVLDHGAEWQKIAIEELHAIRYKTDAAPIGEPK